MLNISISNLAMQTQEIERILQKCPFINKYYGKGVTTSSRRGGRLRDAFINNNKSNSLYELEGFLEKLDSELRNGKIEELINKIEENPENLLNLISEFKVATFLVDKVGGDNTTPLPENRSPDFEIEILGKTITIEVKRIEDKRETHKGNVKYNPDPTLLNSEWTDEQTIYNSIEKSIITNHQYHQNIPHIILFDCNSASSIDESEFETVLYGKKDESDVKPTYSKITGKFIGMGAPYYEYGGVFFKKNRKGNFIYSCLSGVVAFLESQGIIDSENISMIHKNRRIVFFRNPNADLNIDAYILSSLGMKIREIMEE